MEHPWDYEIWIGERRIPVSGSSVERAIANAKRRLADLGLAWTDDTHLRDYDGWTVWEAKIDA